MAGAAAAALIGPSLVLVLLGCGVIELGWQRRFTGGTHGQPAAISPLLPASITSGGIGALAWTAFKVGALSFGGGFVIIPLMQGDAVHTYHWMSNAQFLNAVALGQIIPRDRSPRPSPPSATPRRAFAGGVLAALVAFSPSFSFILLGGGRFEQLHGNTSARAFLDGAGRPRSARSSAP